ncbi:MAG TPA: DNA polymerase III subunit beta [Candidatus Onthousia excrementipullorum]|uniref:Beta sliding clamp n=1 Tax=Candidatus Onthousia excrementipullorum TaxID=2840884 RepID=A0A9D1DVE0_9FIRM|nr:DNA polymerase III subunit beta [Candidatus Onthousia excrementipullorum]
MKFTIKKEVLMEAINKVSKAISSRNVIPVLAGIKFELTSKKLVLTASDNDITIQTHIDCDNEEIIKVKEEGSIIIQGKYISDIVRKLPDPYINIEVVDELKILIYTENSEFNLNGISESEYPNIDLGESKSHIELLPSVLKEIVNQTAFATSIDENKAILNGINFNITGDMLECNATDSYRLARKVIKLDKVSKENQNIVIPSRNLVEFTRIIDDSDEMIEIHIFNNKILFKYQNLLFQSRLINGTYPNTSNLLPKDYLVKLHFNINQFYDVVDRVSILTSDKDKNTVTLETDGNNLIMKSSSAEIGRVEEKMTITKDQDIDVKVSFSSKYMMDALKSFNTETVELHFVGEIKPILLKSSEDETLTQLVLPIRTY